ncbi:EAL domain-containing protein [Vibrio sp. RC27]
MQKITSLTKEDLIGFHHKKELPFAWKPNTNEFKLDLKVLRTMHIISQETELATVEDFITLFSENDRRRLINMLELAVQGGDPEPIKICMVTASNNISLCLISVKRVSENFIVGVLMPLFVSPTSEDLSSICHQLFENQHRGMIVTDDETRIIACNSLFEQNSGYRIDEILGKKTSIFNAGKHGNAFFEDMWEKLNTQGFWSGLILSKTKSGKAIPQELVIQKITSIRNNVYYLGSAHNLSEKLYRVAGREHGGIELLTQLPGQDEFELKLKNTVDTLTEDQGMLVVSFIPNFNTETEDVFESKKQLASALAYYENDCIAGCLHKDVFVIGIVYSRSSDMSHSQSIFRAIRTRFNTIKQRVEAEVYRKISSSTIGVSVLGMDTNIDKNLISHSLQAMYEKHSSNGTNFCFYNRSLHDQAKVRECNEDIVRKAIQEKTLEVYYQPIVCTHQWKVTKLEALCRFKDQNGKLLDTGEMINVAEELSLITELDLTIAEMAIKSRDKLAALFGNDIQIAINISLNSNKPIKKMFQDLMKVFKSYAHHLPFITIELTESAYFNSEDNDSNLLLKLRQKGLKIAIDDFGTGYSSFAYLKDGNFDVLKIDRDFITNLTVGSNNYYIVKMVTHLAHTLEVKVVAEGVENIQEVHILKELNVDYLQGFYFERPMPVTKLTPKTNDKIRKLVKDLDNSGGSKVSLIIQPPLLSPDNNLKDIKTIFDDSSFSVLPVVVDKKCVGIITREQFYLYSTPSLGTERETMQDYQSLCKRVSAMMNVRMKVVHETINDGEIHEKIRNNYIFPWIVINDMGQYMGIIDSHSMNHYLNER